MKKIEAKLVEVSRANDQCGQALRAEVEKVRRDFHAQKALLPQDEAAAMSVGKLTAAEVAECKRA